MTLENLMSEVPGTSAFELLVIRHLDGLTDGQEEQKKELVAVGLIAEQTLKQATLTNGRVSELEAWKNAVAAQSHDKELINGYRRQQREQVKAAAFSLIRALDYPWFTGSVVAILVGAGWVLGNHIPLPW